MTFCAYKRAKSARIETLTKAPARMKLLVIFGLFLHSHSGFCQFGRDQGDYYRIPGPPPGSSPYRCFNGWIPGTEPHIAQDVLYNRNNRKSIPEYVCFK